MHLVLYVDARDMPEQTTASERAIEDIFAQSPAIVTEVLETMDHRPRLVERQQSLPSGRADLVYLSGEDVLLVELKVVAATDDHIDQIAGYVADYEAGASGTEFAGDRSLIPILLAPDVSQAIQEECQRRGIRAETYDIGDVLDHFEESLFAGLAQFQVAGLVTSVAGVSLLHGYLRHLSRADGAVSVEEAAKRYSKIGKGDSSNPVSRVNNFRKMSQNLGLVIRNEDGMRLTERGERYVAAGDDDTLWQVTAEQADVVVELLYDEPFYSDLTFSLQALLRSVFELSKNSHPVPREEIQDWYAKKVGKRDSWGDRTRKDVVQWLGRYLDELGLISTIDQEFYLTPRGFNLLSYAAIDEGKTMLRSRDRSVAMVAQEE